MQHFDPLENHLSASVVAWFGGKPSVPKVKQQELPPVQQVQIPEPVAPLPPPPPAPSESKMEVQDKMSQQRIDAKKRRGMAASLIAGETGGFKSSSPASSATGSTSLLG